MEQFKLRDYQEQISSTGAELVLSQLGMVCYPIEVRVGKTLIALETARKANATKVLFITKLKAISSINSDYEQLHPGYELMATNYENLHKIPLGYYDFIIVDECHKLGAFPKPNKCQQQVKKLVGDNPVILMSGTFTPESYAQIYHILTVCNKTIWGKYKNFYAWAKDYVQLQHKFLYGRQINDYSQLSEFGQKIVNAYMKDLSISYTQEESGFKQEVQERIFQVDMMPKTYDMIKRLKQDRVIEGKTGTILADTEVKLMNKMHQMYSGTVKLEDGSAVIFDKSKAMFIDDKFFHNNKKLAIFYKFIEEGKLLREYFPNNTDDAAVFNQDTTHLLIFIGQIQSHREGVNLSTADYLIMYNIDYAAVSYFQARARMQSKDRVKEALVYWIFAKGSIEYMIYNAVKNKKNYTLSHFRKDANIRKQTTV